MCSRGIKETVGIEMFLTFPGTGNEQIDIVDGIRFITFRKETDLLEYTYFEEQFHQVCGSSSPPSVLEDSALIPSRTISNKNLKQICSNKTNEKDNYQASKKLSKTFPRTEFNFLNNNNNNRNNSLNLANENILHSVCNEQHLKYHSNVNNVNILINNRNDCKMEMQNKANYNDEHHHIVNVRWNDNQLSDKGIPNEFLSSENYISRIIKPKLASRNVNVLYNAGIQVDKVPYNGEHGFSIKEEINSLMNDVISCVEQSPCITGHECSDPDSSTPTNSSRFYSERFPRKRTIVNQYTDDKQQNIEQVKQSEKKFKGMETVLSELNNDAVVPKEFEVARKASKEMTEVCHKNVGIFLGMDENIQVADISCNNLEILAGVENISEVKDDNIADNQEVIVAATSVCKQECDGGNERLDEQQINTDTEKYSLQIEDNKLKGSVNDRKSIEKLLNKDSERFVKRAVLNVALDERDADQHGPDTPGRLVNSVKASSLSGNKEKSLCDILIWCDAHVKYNCECRLSVYYMRGNTLLWTPNKKSKQKLSTIKIPPKFINEIHLYELEENCARTAGSLINYSLRNKCLMFKKKRYSEIFEGTLTATNSYVKIQFDCHNRQGESRKVRSAGKDVVMRSANYTFINNSDKLSSQLIEVCNLSTCCKLSSFKHKTCNETFPATSKKNRKLLITKRSSSVDLFENSQLNSSLNDDRRIKADQVQDSSFDVDLKLASTSHKEAHLTSTNIIENYNNRDTNINHTTTDKPALCSGRFTSLPYHQTKHSSLIKKNIVKKKSSEQNKTSCYDVLLTQFKNTNRSWMAEKVYSFEENSDDDFYGFDCSDNEMNTSSLVSALARSAVALTGLSRSPAAANGLAGSAATLSGLASSPATAGGLTRATAALSGVSRSSAATNGLAGSAAALSGLVKSPAALSGLVKSPAALSGLSRSAAALNGFARSPAAVNGLASSPAALSGLSRSSAAANELAGTAATLSGFSRSPAAVNGLASSPTALSGLSRSLAALRGLARSPAAMIGIARSPAAENGLARSAASVSYCPRQAHSSIELEKTHSAGYNLIDSELVHQIRTNINKIKLKALNLNHNRTNRNKRRLLQTKYSSSVANSRSQTFPNDSSKSLLIKEKKDLIAVSSGQSDVTKSFDRATKDGSMLSPLNDITNRTIS